MRRTASEMIRSLEMRVARLERVAGWAHKYDTSKYRSPEALFDVVTTQLLGIYETKSSLWVNDEDDKIVGSRKDPRKLILDCLEDRVSSLTQDRDNAKAEYTKAQRSGDEELLEGAYINFRQLDNELSVLEKDKEAISRGLTVTRQMGDKGIGYEIRVF